MKYWDRYRRIEILEDGYVTFPFLSTYIPDFEQYFLLTFNKTYILQKRIQLQHELVSSIIFNETYWNYYSNSVDFERTFLLEIINENSIITRLNLNIINKILQKEYSRLFLPMST